VLFCPAVTVLINITGNAQMLAYIFIEEIQKSSGEGAHSPDPTLFGAFGA